MIRRFTSTFVAGLFALLPLLITVGLILFLTSKLNAWLGPRSYFGELMLDLAGRERELFPVWLAYLLSLAAVVIFIWLIGYGARAYLGRRIGNWFEEWIIRRIPFINEVYSSAEQVVDLFRKKDGGAVAALSNVVLARIANTRVLGMLASPDPVIINDVRHYLIYFPSTPVPATGFNYFVPCEDVDDVRVTVEEMTRIIVSLGSLGPGIMNQKAPLILPKGDLPDCS